MELRNLRVLVEVVRQGGFTEAARVLFSTQSTVSKAIRALEDELGVVLLHRGSRTVGLTAAGAIVLRHSQKMLGLRDDMLTEIAELRGVQRGTLRLGLPRIGRDALFAPIFARFCALYPGIDIELREAGSARLRELLQSGELDLGVTEFQRLIEANPDYVAAYFHGGQALEKLGRLEDARATYEQGVTACQRTGDAHALAEMSAALDLL